MYVHIHTIMTFEYEDRPDWEAPEVKWILLKWPGQNLPGCSLKFLFVY